MKYQNKCLKWQVSNEPFILMCREKKRKEKKNAYTRPNLVRLSWKSRLQMVTIKYTPIIQCM